MLNQKKCTNFFLRYLYYDSI